MPSRKVCRHCGASTRNLEANVCQNCGMPFPGRTPVAVPAEPEAVVIEPIPVDEVEETTTEESTVEAEPVVRRRTTTVRSQREPEPEPQPKPTVRRTPTTPVDNDVDEEVGTTHSSFWSNIGPWAKRGFNLIAALLLLAVLFMALIYGWRLLNQPWGRAAQAATASSSTWTPVPPVNPMAAPAATATPTEAVVVTDQDNWPQTPAEAATLFGGEASRWEVSAEGGWHLIEAHERIMVNPSGFTLEGYYDTNPGRDPRQFVSTAAVEVQGCTIWQTEPEDLFCAMMQQKKVSPGDIDAIGFQKPNCP